MKYRMYSLVLRQLNPIQKGVQTAHSVVEYASLYFKTEEYQNWSNFDKTLIMLDGGTYPEMMEILEELQNEGINHAYFEEEDLNNLVTSITLIADERVWDKVNYPDFTYQYDTVIQSVDAYNDWVESIGGEKNSKLRSLLSSKRLSN